MPAQLLLPISLPDGETFASFYAGRNQILIAAIQSLLKQSQPGYLYFWSMMTGAGRSHLLHAACAAFSINSQAVGYVPLEQHHTFSPEIVEGMEQLGLLCIDNIHAVAGQGEWELALFNLYNRIREKGICRLLISSDRPPRQLSFQLPDLISRLEWGQIYRLLPLLDEEKLVALQLRARLRGFELPEEVGRFLLKRLDREMPNLFQVLDQLDRASISAQRKLTIPFVKEILQV